MITLICVPFLVAFAVSMAFGPVVIGVLKRSGVGQRISEDGPESHHAKAGTPTMGGLIILAGVLAGTLAAALLMGTREWGYAGPISVLLLAGSYGGLGMVDDYLTIHPRGGIRGISSKPKAALQTLIAIAFVVWLGRSVDFMPVLTVAGRPIIEDWLYYAFAVIFIVGMANFINITDGLDGLVSGLTGIICAALVICGLMLPSADMPADTTTYIVLCATAGACLAFLWFNTNPARVFMGDTGSLALGVALPAIAILTHREVLLIVAGMVFVIEGLSTAIQWAVFKYTRIRTGTGRRVFRKSPLHHHFELCGWPEQTVVVRFWIMGVIAAVIAFAGAAWGIW